MAGAWRTVAQKTTPPALYWLVLSLITFLGMSAVIKIEATRTRLSLVVVVVGVAFSAACFLERLLRDYMRTDMSDFSGSRNTTSQILEPTVKNIFAKIFPWRERHCLPCAEGSPLMIK